MKSHKKYEKQYLILNTFRKPVLKHKVKKEKRWTK